MQLFVVVLAIAASAVTALPVEESIKEYPRIITYQGENGETQTIDLDEPLDMEVLSDIARNPSHNKYLLYSRSNPTAGYELVYRSPDTLRNAPLDVSKPTIVIAHGWLNNQNSDINSVIRDAYLDNYDVNVIVVDWKRLARKGYVTAATGVPAVGKGLGQFLHWLHENTGLQIENVHLIGFSLGAHLVGNAGKYLGGKVARITGLDPAGPLWQYNSNRLSSADGLYVEAIHTHGGIVAGLGIGTVLGHADFFPNGGNNQPGCLTPICDHNRSWQFFAASIRFNHLIGNECTSSLQLSLNRCKGKQLHLGEADLRKWGTGKYRVNTKRKYPY